MRNLWSDSRRTRSHQIVFFSTAYR